MTSAQELTLRYLCANYYRPVVFDPGNYRPAGGLPAGWVVGLVGPVEVVVSPDGEGFR
jgi:hypothetical protein